MSAAARLGARLQRRLPKLRGCRGRAALFVRSAKWPMPLAGAGEAERTGLHPGGRCLRAGMRQELRLSWDVLRWTFSLSCRCVCLRRVHDGRLRGRLQVAAGRRYKRLLQTPTAYPSSARVGDGSCPSRRRGAPPGAGGRPAWCPSSPKGETIGAESKGPWARHQVPGFFSSTSASLRQTTSTCGHPSSRDSETARRALPPSGANDERTSNESSPSRFRRERTSRIRLATWRIHLPTWSNHLPTSSRHHTNDSDGNRHARDPRRSPNDLLMTAKEQRRSSENHLRQAFDEGRSSRARNVPGSKRKRTWDDGSRTAAKCERPWPRTTRTAAASSRTCDDFSRSGDDCSRSANDGERSSCGPNRSSRDSRAASPRDHRT